VTESRRRHRAAAKRAEWGTQPSASGAKPRRKKSLAAVGATKEFGGKKLDVKRFGAKKFGAKKLGAKKSSRLRTAVPAGGPNRSGNPASRGPRPHTAGRPAKGRRR